MDNFVPLVVPGLSVSSGTNPSSTSTLQDLSSSDPAQERSVGLAPRNWPRTPKHQNQIKKGPIEMRMDLCEIFLNGWRSSQIMLTSQKTENCEVCLRTKMTRAPCRRRTGEAVPRAETFCDLITADHKVFNEEGESRNDHRYAVVVQDLANLIHATRLHRRRTRVSEGRAAKAEVKLFWDLAYLVKIYHGIIVCQHFIDPRRMEVAERALRLIKEGTSVVMLQSDLDVKWWADSMEGYCYLRNDQDLLIDVKTPCD